MGRARRGVRPFLLCLLLLLVIWAAYRLWPMAPAEPDFELRLWPGGGALFAADLSGDAGKNLPVFHEGHFYSEAGVPISPHTIIRNNQQFNIDSPSYIAIFRLRDDATRAELAAAAKQIWAVCDAAIYIPIKGRDDVIPFLSPSGVRDCAELFDSDGNHTDRRTVE